MVSVDKSEFKAAARTILSNSRLGGEQGICPDQYVGLISSMKPTDSDFSERSPVKRVEGSDRSVLLVLESPHIQEFEGNGGPGPAKGHTGRAIRTYLRGVLNWKEYEGWGLILINAVQYQCSHGTKPLDIELRNQNFRYIWGQDGRENFIDRLEGIYRDGDVIVNACTKGASSKTGQLREMVQKALIGSKNIGKPENILRRFHPASWSRSLRMRTGTWPC